MLAPFVCSSKRGGMEPLDAQLSDDVTVTSELRQYAICVYTSVVCWVRYSGSVSRQLEHRGVSNSIYLTAFIYSRSILAVYLCYIFLVMSDCFAATCSLDVALRNEGSVVRVT